MALIAADLEGSGLDFGFFIATGSSVGGFKLVLVLPPDDEHADADEDDLPFDCALAPGL